MLIFYIACKLSIGIWIYLMTIGYNHLECNSLKK